MLDCLWYKRSDGPFYNHIFTKSNKLTLNYKYNEHLQMCQELKKLVMDLENTALAENKIRERIIRNGQLTTEGNLISETMQVEDLAALEKVTEDNILNELQTKLARGNFTSFVGDILLILNPNTNEDIYDEIVRKYYY